MEEEEEEDEYGLGEQYVEEAEADQEDQQDTGMQLMHIDGRHHLEWQRKTPTDWCCDDVDRSDANYCCHDRRSEQPDCSSRRQKLLPFSWRSLWTWCRDSCARRGYTASVRAYHCSYQSSKVPHFRERNACHSLQQGVRKVMMHPNVFSSDYWQWFLCTGSWWIWWICPILFEMSLLSAIFTMENHLLSICSLLKLTISQSILRNP